MVKKKSKAFNGRYRTARIEKFESAQKKKSAKRKSKKRNGKMYR